MPNIKCPYCLAEIEVDPSNLGQLVVCPNDSMKFRARVVLKAKLSEYGFDDGADLSNPSSRPTENKTRIEQIEEEIRVAKKAVFAPALACMFIVCLTISIECLCGYSVLIELPTLMRNPSEPKTIKDGASLLLFITGLFIFRDLVILSGSICMISLRSKSFAKLAMILGFVPFSIWGLALILGYVPFGMWGLPVIPFGIWGFTMIVGFVPFGIWGLRILRRPEVVQGFQAKTEFLIS